MKTIWGEHIDQNAVLKEYPRPQLVRDSYLNLNGKWDYAITDTSDAPKAWDGEILVPFSPESELSGVGRTLQPNQWLWYRRSFTLPKGFQRGVTLMHFGAVDQDATVYLNGVEAGSHQGGYNAFTLDVSALIKEGENTLCVRVTDETDAGWKTRGKQTQKRGGIWYTPQSGIWQTVWLESAPVNYIKELLFTPSKDAASVEVTVVSPVDAPCEIELEGETLTVSTNQKVLLPIENPRLWSPENPCLYPVTARLGQDRVESYFAMRTFTLEADEKVVKRLFLNGKPYFQSGLLDQGYYPDGLYTAPSDEAMIFDIKTAKDMGFTMLRKHIKVEPMRWYYHCDRIGMIVWQDMPSGGSRYKPLVISAPLVTGLSISDRRYRAFRRESAEGREAYQRELAEMIHQLRGVPSIGLWVPFNEGWGQFDAAKAYQLIDQIDGTRPIDHASGWHDQKIGQIKSLHVYFKPYRFKADKQARAVVLSEFGGYNLHVKEHCFNQVDFGYRRFDTPEALLEAYQRLYEKEILPAFEQGLSASVYTQLTDVEDELNGLITYDRKVVKLPVEAVRRINERFQA